MIISSATVGSEWFLNGLSGIQRQEERTQREISSGYRVQDAADAPAQTPKLVALGSRLASFQDWQTNLDQIGAEASAGDNAIGTAVSLIENARALAVHGTGATLSDSDRQNIASQIQSIQEQIVSVANTNVQGRYIFGGDQDSFPPYRLNAASPGGVDSLTAQTATRIVKGPDGETVFQSATASQIFDQPGASNAFGALENLRVALVGNDQAGIAAALQSLQSVSDGLNLRQARYGNAETEITNAKTSAGNEIVSLQTSLSAIRDTDIAQAASDLARETTAQSAATAAQGEISRKTLFDYLA